MVSRKANQARYYAKKRSIVVAAKSSPCADCGRTYHPFVMDFDHVRGVKAFNISKLNKSIDRLIAEIKKCEVVCSNCHRMRTLSRYSHVG